MAKARRAGSRAARAGALALTIALSGDASASAVRAMSLPLVSATSGEVREGPNIVIQVRSLFIQRIEGVPRHPRRLRVSCNRCQRRPTAIAEDYPTPTSKLFVGVNWLLREGRGIKVTVVRPGYLGRFVRLTVRRRGTHLRLTYRDSGCLNGARRLVRCPRGSKKVSPGRPVPTAAAAPQPPVPPASGGPAMPSPEVPPPVGSGNAVCSDGLDNDGDGNIDFGRDPGCSSATDGAEKEAVCSDGLDNDGDGKTDFPQDRGCVSAEGSAENPPACSDGLDNDGDGKTDYPKDPNCSSATDGAEKD